MSRDKRIEEMAKLIHLNYDMPLEFTEGLAEFLIDEGYRKASDVALEFIEAVDEMMELVTAMTGLSLTYHGKYAELKKKYTEDKGAI